MSEFTFAPPSGGGGYLTPKDHFGHALLIKQVHEIDKHFDQLKNNRQGAEVDRARFDYVCLDCADQELVEDAFNTHIGIVSRLKRYAGTPQMVLARVGQTAPSQPGMSGAFVLDDATNDQGVIAKATAWLNAWQAKQFAAPANAPAAAPVAAVTAPVPAAFNPQAQMLGNTPIGQQMAAPTPELPDPVALELMQYGYAPDVIAGLKAGGQDLNAVLQLAKQLNATPAPAA